MPRRSKPPSYRLHKASGRAIVTIAGKMHYLGEYDSPASKAKYATKLAEWSAQEGGPPSTPPSELTILELAQLFREHAQRYYCKDGRPTGEAGNFDHAIKPLLKLYGKERVEDFGPRKLDAVRNLMITGFTDAKGKRVRPWCRKVINRQVGRLRQIFRWAVSQELAPSSLYQALRALEPLKAGRGLWRETDRVLPVDDRHVAATLPFLPLEVADMVRVQRLTGCRTSEICNMRVGEIDRTTEEWVYRPATHKTIHHGIERLVPIGPKAQEILLSYLVREAVNADSTAAGAELDRCERRDANSYCFSSAESERKRKAMMREARKSPVQPSQQNRAKRKSKRTPQDHYNRFSYARAIKRARDTISLSVRP